MVLALDIGTSRVRAALFDVKGNRVEGSAASDPNELRTGADGRATLDPRALLASVEVVIRLATRGVDPYRIRAVGGSCIWHSLIGVDTRGNPTTPVLTWADTRSATDSRDLRQQLDEGRFHARTGCMLRPSFWPAKLRWLERTSPKTFSRTSLWLGPAEWIWWRLGAGMSCSPSMASGTGLFRTGAPEWDGDLLEECGISALQLPDVLEEPWGDDPAPWFPAIGDGAASNLGSGGTGPATAAINFGTSAAFRVVTDRVPADLPFGLFAYRLDLERYVIGGASSNAGNLRAWCRRELGLPDDAALEAALAERPLPDHGLTVLPYWSGERAPRWRETVTGAVAGIRQSTTALDILQATTEAACCRIAEIADLVVGDDQVEIVVSGGGCRSPSELQRLANVMGRPVRASLEPEASLRGAAVFALEQLGETVGPPALGDVAEPDAEAVARYAEFRRRQSVLDARLNP